MPRSTVTASQCLTGGCATTLLYPFVTNQAGFDTGITISSTSADPFGTLETFGTCILSFYGDGAPFPNTGIVVPSGLIAPGSVAAFTLSSVAPGFQGYMIASCNFILARGEAVLIDLASLVSQSGPLPLSLSEEAEIVTLPRAVPATSSLLFPFVSGQAGFDTPIAIANTTADPFGSSGATPASGACEMYFYGNGAPTTSVPVPGGAIAAGGIASFYLSGVAPGFQGYMIVQCAFGGAVGYAFEEYDLGLPDGLSYSVTPEQITLPRSSTPKPLLFPALTNQSGSDSGIVIANTSSDPFGSRGATPSSGPCTLNFYGSGAPKSPRVTPTISAGSVYATALSQIAPGFQGYVTASCTFGEARGFADISSTAQVNDYSQTAEVLSIPRSSAASNLLFSFGTQILGYDTDITISNTSKDSFGTSPVSGACGLYFYGAGAPPFNPAATTPAIPAGGQYSFALSSIAPGFQGYFIADCDFPLARGTADIIVPSDILSVSPDSAPVGSPGITLTVNGTGFTPLNLVVWNGSPLPTTFVNSGTVTASVSAGLLTAAGTATVSVAGSNGVNFYVVPPTISSLSPSSIPGGNPVFTIYVAGTGFVSGVSTVYFNGQALLTTFVDSTLLSAVVPANQSGFNVPVTVFNLAQPSNELIFTLGSPQFSCAASLGNGTAGSTAPQLRVGGEAELIGELDLACTSPSSSGGVVNQDITVSPSGFNFTSRILNTSTNATEALLLVGDPEPGSQVLGTNVFQGELVGSNIVFPAVPLNTSQSTTIRIFNLRANTLGMAPGVSQSAAVNVNMGSISVTNAVQTLGSVLPVTFATTVYSAGTQRSVELQFNAAPQGVTGVPFRPRVASGGVQDEPGTAYSTESGFVNAALLPGAGLADFGTRLLLQVNGVPAGVSVYAALTSDDGSAALVAADDTGNGGEGVLVSGSSMFGGGNYAPINIFEGTGTAVWEVISGNSTASLSFNIVMTGMNLQGLGSIALEGGLAPLNPVTTATATDPLPRFVSDLLTGYVNLHVNQGSAAAVQSSGAQAAALLAMNASGSPAVAAALLSQSLPQSPIQIGSSVTLNYNLVNLSSAAAATVTASTTVTPPLTVTGCSAPGGKCTSIVTNPDNSTSVSAVYTGPYQPGESVNLAVTVMCNPAVNPSCTDGETGVAGATATGLGTGQKYLSDSYPPDNTSSSGYALTSKPVLVTVQFATSPPGLLLKVGNAAPAANPPATTVDQGASLTFQAPTPQTGGPNGTGYVFASWSDGSTSAVRTGVSAPLGGAAFTANFITGYPLNVKSTGGSVTLNPAGGYYPRGQIVEITATPSAGATFTGFTGDVSGGNSMSITMPAQALNIQANFENVTQTITFSAPKEVTFGVTPFTISATASSGLTVLFTSTTIDVCTVSGTTVTIVGAGICSVTASQGGNATYAAAVSVARSFDVTPGPQTITFAPLSTQVLGAAPFSVTAMASSGLTVNIESNTKPVCTVSGFTVTMLEGGICSITASQPGNAEWKAAAPVTRTFTVLKTQTISFPAPASQTLGEKPFALKATSTSDLAISFTSNSESICTVTGVTVTLLEGGTCSITASQGGNASYTAAVSVTQQFVVLLAQTITFGTLPNEPLNVTPPALAATASSNLTVMFTSTTLSVCLVAGVSITLLAEGKCTIAASQPGNTTYAAAPSVLESFTVLQP